MSWSLIHTLIVCNITLIGYSFTDLELVFPSIKSHTSGCFCLQASSKGTHFLIFGPEKQNGESPRLSYLR